MAHLIIGRKVHCFLSQMVELLEREKNKKNRDWLKREDKKTRKIRYVKKTEREKMGRDSKYRTIKQRKGERQKEKNRETE